MAGGQNTALILGGVGAAVKALPPEYQSTFGTAKDIAMGAQAQPQPTGGPISGNSIAPGPAPATSGGFGDFMRSKTGIVLGLALIAGLGFMLYKGRH